MNDIISIYVKGLPQESRDRYLNKPKYDKNTGKLPDPYMLTPSKWISDPSLWPELVYPQLYSYLIETPALFNATIMRAHKSLEAYKYLT